MARLALLIFLCFISTSLAKTFSKCELVYELRRQGFPEHLMKDLVCLIGESSSYRTHVIGGPDPDGSYNYGLFQINNFYWCSSGPYPGNICNVRCEDLRSDDITVASNCAKIILNTRGLQAWVAWEKFCKPDRLPELGC
ncbi:unnamed protein product [Arctia plantaginis]|uniref:Lysozyme n=1 Tax=Arctia plantaginis TaxID=874455 RepID=A0A8S0ZS87_ARCPL|nr:unnamed protein product [Arctia plantaginis]